MIFFGAILAALIVFGAYRARALSIGGSVSAWLIGTVIFGVGGWTWAAALVTFFVSSSALSRWRRRDKESLGFEKGGRRDAGQVWANGGVATACALLSFPLPAEKPHLHVLFLAALAAANADTWATEIGAVLGGKPYDLRTLRPVSPGASGAVSGAGTAAALAGALLLGLFSASHWLPITLAGFGGALCDSLLGATVQAQWRDPLNSLRWTERLPPGSDSPTRGITGFGNDVVNLLCTLFAIILCACFLVFP